MHRPLLVIVTGLPATGKTSVARDLASQLNLPLITKDDIKERLYDTLGWDDAAWSERLDPAVYAILAYVIEAQLGAGLGVVVESNFEADEHTALVRGWQEACAAIVVQILCDADRDVLVERFEERAFSADRHPGHADDEKIVDFKETAAEQPPEALDLGGPVLRIDTTEPETIDLDPAIQVITSTVEAARRGTGGSG